MSSRGRQGSDVFGEMSRIAGPYQYYLHLIQRCRMAY